MAKPSLLVLLALFIGCTDAADPPIEEGNPWDDGVASDGKDDSAAGGCFVRPPPESLGLSPFYEKYCSARGLPVIAAGVVPNAAVQYATRIASAMMANMPNVQEALVENHFRLGIIGASQLTTDMPEYSHYDPSLNARARGLADNPLVSSAEENVLCYEKDGWRGENILVHEFAHTIKGMLEFYVHDVDPAFQASINSAFDAAIAAGLYRSRDGTLLYAGTNPEEYWAEGVQNYFDVHAHHEGEEGPITPADLAAYDPTLYAIIDDTFHDVRLPAKCPTPSFVVGARYRIESFRLGSEFTLDGARLAEAANVRSQRWEIRALFTGGFRISVGDQALAVTADGGATLVPFASSAAQTWRITPVAAGIFRVTNDQLGPARSLGADPAGVHHELVLGPTGDGNQGWKITRLFR